MLSGVDLLKLDDQTSQTDNHDKYIEVRKIMWYLSFQVMSFISIIYRVFNF